MKSTKGIVMSNSLKLSKPLPKLYCVYVKTQEDGALLIRVGQRVQNLAVALNRVGKYTQAATIELREYFGGKETLLKCWTAGKELGV